MTVKIRIPLKNASFDATGLTTTAPMTLQNVIPSGFGYVPLKAFNAVSTNALSGKAIGAISAQASDGSAKVFAGSSTALYSLTGGTFSDVSKSGGYAVSETETWSLVQYGQRLIATWIGDAPQYFDLNSSTLFANLAGSPPQARHVSVIRDFVVFGNTSTDPGEVYWSGFNDSESWTKGLSQCDSQILQEGGWINRIVGGEVGYIFQERAITRMTYVGPPLIFQFDVVEKSRGLAAPGALATVGSTSFYWSGDAFYSFDPVNGSQPIGNKLVDKFLQSDISTIGKQYVSAAVDTANKIVMFSFPATFQTDQTTPAYILFYHWLDKEWSLAAVQHDMIFTSLTQARTLEGLDTSYTSIEDIPVSLDSRVWTGGQTIQGIFDKTHTYGLFQGSNLSALIEIPDFEPIPGKRSIITGIRPITDSTDVTIKLYGRESLASGQFNSSTTAQETNGVIPFTFSARYHVIRLDIPANATWTYINALDITAEEDGEI